ncbi:inositol monophosphatase family protein [Luedemannella flava]|uniref:inositol-phosphate phosphatase n=1 Tax=Luedemannella flava TaxID=349316 RepID=A0ABN2LJT6_9ACTN
MAVACAAVDVARDIFLSRSPTRLTAKGARDMASDVDYAIERELTVMLRRRTPDIGFLGEEDGRSGPSGELIWTLDPIDGTVNFVHGSPLCGISLALLRDGTPIVGVVDLPKLGLRYTAASGLGAYRDGRRLAASGVSRLSEAVVAIGDYAVGKGAERKNDVRLAVTRRLAARAQRVRMHGSAAIDLVWLAEGRVDAVVMMANQPWDTAAGVVIAREAGAVVVDSDGSDHDSTSCATIGGDAALVPSLLAIVSGSVAEADRRVPV